MIEWETYWGVFQVVVLLAGSLGSVLFGPRVYKAQKARSTARETERRQAILAAAARASSVDVTALQTQLAEQQHQLDKQQQQIADQHAAIEALEKWNDRQQERIVELENENDRLQQALADERADRKRLEQLVTELRVDKAELEGQINAYQRMFAQLLGKSLVTPVGEMNIPAG